MGKYSSDSDYERRTTKKTHKSKRRTSRSSSSDSGDSGTCRRKDKKSDRHRSKSHDRYAKSRRSRSSSKQASYKSKHYKSRDVKRSTSQSRYKHRSKRSRSRSRSYIREFSCKVHRRSTSSSSTSSSTSNSKKQQSKKLKPAGNSNRVQDKTEEKFPVLDSKTLEEINNDAFIPKHFSSGFKKVPENIVIDLTKQTIKVPEVEPIEPDTIYHNNLFLNEEARMEKWIKELYSYRQKALQQGLRQ